MNYLVIKCGGSIISELPEQFFKNILKIQKEKRVMPLIVHGGGPMISSQLKKMGVVTTFVDGLRVTTNEVLDVVEMVLSGSINKQIVRKLTQCQVKAFGMSGVDGELLQAIPAKNVSKIGHVGEVKNVNAELITSITHQGYVPVISPLAIGADSERYNINADMAASAIARALEAPLCFISDIPGIYVEENGRRNTLHHTTSEQIEQLIEQKVIYGGMIPKVQAALQALTDCVPEVSIVNGKDPNHLIDFIDGKSVGTRIQLKEATHA